MEQQRPASQKFPAGLTGILNSPDDNRDSAYYSSTDSKHNSTASGLGVLSPPNSGFQTSPVDKTPSPTTTNHLLPQPLVSPTNSNMSVASIVSPTTPGSADPRRFDRPQSLDSAPNSATFAHGDMPEALSRRESVDSRFNQGFGNLGLGNSPYATHNHSTTSIHNTLQQQRNPRANMDSLAINRISNGYQPNAERKPEGIPKMKVAPAITGPATSQIARAAEPTKGQAWAFPEDEMPRMPPAQQAQSLINSRRSSIADSLASSQFTTESRLPVGQRRLEDSLTPSEFHRLSTASQEFSTTHHHSLQHRQISDLQSEEHSPQSGNQPYSRTPELRVTHKLAERKRRTEMKELFDQLRDLMPQERGQKASKWEILTKAISEHQRQTGIIRDLSQHIQAQSEEITKQRAQIEKMERQIQELHQYSQKPHMHGGAPQQHPSDPYAPDFARSRPPELPPLRGNFEGPPVAAGPDSMTGVQYDGPRINGVNNYRPPAGPRY